ncbi:hypothetical protein ECA0810 [Pectobacterium atrosepticum SCRI1043]|uniref:Uncharacterized protein n=1 Tax=Pectobacterium atrosepticum (strain SCRI 1043 / ATCC BAA-672) TaxID=218491 RepID=Q6D910_PECAS|nr:hypothetical protein ECA0810 [Pectobacterium atrosepticum SCRI1043]
MNNRRLSGRKSRYVYFPVEYNDKRGVVVIDNVVIANLASFSQQQSIALVIL